MMRLHFTYEYLGLVFDGFSIFIVLRRSEQAWNDLYNPEFITLMISVLNSGLWMSFRACSDRRRTMKLRQIRVLTLWLVFVCPPLLVGQTMTS